MQPETLIVFDIDGTLTESLPAHITSFKEALAGIGVPEYDSNFKAYKHHTDSYIAKEIFETNTNEEFTAQKMKAFESFLFKRIQEFQINEIPGAKALIDQLDLRDEIAYCYATGSLLRPAIYKLESIGLTVIPELLVASDQLEEREQIVSKAILKAKKHYQVSDFNRVISIGDGLWDYKTAVNLGLEFIGVGEANRTVMSEHGAELIYPTLLDMKLPLT